MRITELPTPEGNDGRAFVAVRGEIEVRRISKVAEPLAQLFDAVGQRTWEDHQTASLERYVKRYLQRHGLQSAVFGYGGFPSHCCISRNETVAHGVPGSARFTRADIFTLDVSVSRDGWYADAAWSFALPGSSDMARTVVQKAWSAAVAAARVIRAGVSLSDVADAVEGVCGAEDMQTPVRIIPEFAGHGIGRKLHEAPVIPFARVGDSTAAKNVRFIPGMVITVEPAVTNGSGAVRVCEDGWGYRTADSAPAALFELMLVVEDDCTRVISLRGLPVHELPDHPDQALSVALGRASRRIPT